jgi:hypothetical protein
MHIGSTTSEPVDAENQPNTKRFAFQTSPDTRRDPAILLLSFVTLLIALNS